MFYHYAETQIADSTRFLTVLCPKILQAAVFLTTVYLGMIGRQQIALSKGIHVFPPWWSNSAGSPLRRIVDVCET